MPRGWYGEPGRHAQAARGIKSGRHKRPAKPRLGHIYYDRMGVRVRDIPAVSGVDAGIAEVIQAVNDAGFASAQSMSGLKVDYTGKGSGRFSSDGYLGFWKAGLRPEQMEKIRKAARKANFYISESKTDEIGMHPGHIYFAPAISVRTGMLNSGRNREEILKEANRLSGLSVGIPDFLERLPDRDRINKRLMKENGGYISQAEIVRRWKKFTKELTGKNVQVGL